MYAMLYRENLVIHLQCYADTHYDPLLGGSVIRILAAPISPLFEEFMQWVLLLQINSGLTQHGIHTNLVFLTLTTMPFLLQKS